MAYNQSTNYQQLINDAVAKGDLANAAKYEQQRNEKIAGSGSNQQQTSLYSAYLNGSSGNSGNLSYAQAAGQGSQQQVQDVLNRAAGAGTSALDTYRTADGGVSTVRPELAGMTVLMDGRYVSYDANGSPTKSVSAKAAQSYGNDYTKQNMGLDMNSTADAEDVYRAIYNLSQGGNTMVSGSDFNNAYGLRNIQYDRSKSLADYDELIRQAAANGNSMLAGFYEDSRNAMIADQGLDPNLQTARYNGGWNYVDNGGGVGDYTGNMDTEQEQLNLGGGWWQEQDRGEEGMNSKWYNNYTFPTMDEVISYGKALGYDMDNQNVAMSPLVRQMIESGYVSPDTLRRANALKTTVPAALKNLGVESEDGSTGTEALEQAIRVLQQGSGKGSSYADVMANYTPSNATSDGIGVSYSPGSSLEEQLLNLYGENGGYSQALEQLKALTDASTQQATNGYNAQKDQVNQSYSDMFRQLYIDRENNRKNIGQQMAASGITGGASESTLLGLNTNYEESLRQGEQERVNAINELEQAIVNAQLSGDISYAQQAMQLYQQQIDNYAGVLETLLNRQDTLAQQQAALESENKSYAYEQAMALLSAGQMPSSSLLSAAGIDSSTAQSFLTAYTAQNATGSSSSGSGTGSSKPKITLSQTLSPLESGVVNDTTKAAYRYYTGQDWTGDATPTTDETGGYKGNFSSIYEAFATGHPEKAVERIDSIWDSLTDEQKSNLQTVAKSYGYTYAP